MLDVHKVTATSEPDVFILDVSILDGFGGEERGDFVSRPDDTAGLGPAARDWLKTNEHEVLPFVPPTLQEIRASLHSLTRRQLRLGLLTNGITSAQVGAVIEAMPAGVEKEMAKIEWEDASSFERLHPLIASVGGALGLTDVQIDAMWAAAAAL
ncbi:hypothetical protein ASG25_10585 [Rhizobium sp. Leaf384]|nr:hypothetical protein ASG25_10585 [Rhizobium sp. Leaf384]